PATGDEDSLALEQLPDRHQVGLDGGPGKEVGHLDVADVDRTLRPGQDRLGVGDDPQSDVDSQAEVDDAPNELVASSHDDDLFDVGDGDEPLVVDDGADDRDARQPAFGLGGDGLDEAKDLERPACLTGEDGSGAVGADDDGPRTPLRARHAPVREHAGAEPQDRKSVAEGEAPEYHTQSPAP